MDRSNHLSLEDMQVFCDRFSIPERLAKYVPRLFSGEELQAGISNGAGCFSRPEWEPEWLDEEYHRGFLNKTSVPGVYKLNNLYGMLDVFVVSRKEEYDRLFSMQEKHEIDDWYFDTYFEGLKPDENGRLTEDRVMTLDETLEAIKNDPRQIYLNYCDCRSLTGECGKPTRTCLTYKNGPNTFVDRGLSVKLTKEEAMEVVRQADKNGLMHTTMSGGICNCCLDCCYLFRSQKRAGTLGLWPEAKWVVSLSREKCIGCGRCINRCWMGVFTKDSSEKSADMGTGETVSIQRKDRFPVLADPSKCAGCGLCVSTCTKGALTLKRRQDAGSICM